MRKHSSSLVQLTYGPSRRRKRGSLARAGRYPLSRSGMERRVPSSEIWREKYSFSISRLSMRVLETRSGALVNISSASAWDSLSVVGDWWFASCSSRSVSAAMRSRSMSLGAGSSFIIPKLPKSVSPIW